MSKRTLPTPDMLRQLIDYDPETGLLTWKTRTADVMKPSYVGRWNDRWAGKRIATKDRHGYIFFRLDGFRISAHRAAWAISFDKWPDQDVDHINGVRDDNRLSNLRAVSRHENTKNSSIRSDNKSGVTGVSWCRARSMWTVRIKADGKYKFLGYFDSKEDAIAIRLIAQQKYGFHPNHGKRKGRPKPP